MARRAISTVQRGARAVAVVLAVIGVLGARPLHAQLSAADKQTLAELALQWAADGGIPDVKLVKDPANLVVVEQNLPPHTALRMPNRTVALLPPIRIQARADKAGDFLYFRLGPFSAEKGHAMVRVALLWAIGRQAKTPHLSGGGATLEFERRGGEWALLPVSERWSS